MEIFNTIFKDETIRQIRTSKEQPKILKIYDDIPIPTIKSIKRLEQRFYKLMIDKIIPIEIEALLNLELKKHNKKETVYDLCCVIRPTLY